MSQPVFYSAGDCEVCRGVSVS